MVPASKNSSLRVRGLRKGRADRWSTLTAVAGSSSKSIENRYLSSFSTLGIIVLAVADRQAISRVPRKGTGCSSGPRAQAGRLRREKGTGCSSGPEAQAGRPRRGKGTGCSSGPGAQAGRPRHGKGTGCSSGPGAQPGRPRHGKGTGCSSGADPDGDPEPGSCDWVAPIVFLRKGGSVRGARVRVLTNGLGDNLILSST